MFQSIEPLHKYQSESHNEQLPTTELLKVDVKCMINQDLLVMKNNKENTSQMSDIKLEYSIFIEQRYLDEIPALKANYSEQDKRVQLIVICSQGIKIPRGSDFHLLLQQLNTLNLAQYSEKLLYRLLIISMILQIQHITEKIISKLSESLTLYTLFKLLLISIQYESRDYADYFYNLVIEYMQFQGGVYPQQINNPHLQQILLNITTSYIKIIEQDVIEVFLKEKYLKIGTVFFKGIHRAHENRKKKFFQPLQKYQYYKNQRKKTSNDTTYPHHFTLLDEAEGKPQIVAYQASQHSEILLFSKEQVQYHKYTPAYLGVIERNFWGTSFLVYDYGYPAAEAIQFPKYFGQERREILNITYQTNIMASQPRKFNATMFNYVTQQQLSLAQLEPVYNQDKECYQLNFYGRAKRASARNFEVIDPVDKNIIYLLHGKWEKNLFNIDYRYPMSMVQGFSFSLISVSKKFLVQ